MESRGASLRPGARARLAGLWLARTSIAVSLIVVGARSLDVQIALPDASAGPRGALEIRAATRPPDVGGDPSLIPSLALPSRLIPPPGTVMESSSQPSAAGALVPVIASRSLAWQLARPPALRLLAARAPRPAAASLQLRPSAGAPAGASAPPPSQAPPSAPPPSPRAGSPTPIATPTPAPITARPSPRPDPSPPTTPRPPIAHTPAPAEPPSADRTRRSLSSAENRAPPAPARAVRPLADTR
jgi:hypothetical protein